MNYRHAYHAGNFADVVKHIALAAILGHLKKKDTPFAVIDTHVGRGLYDLKSDPGETRNVVAAHPDQVAKLRAAYDRWWQDVLPCLENEEVVGPKVNPFKAKYWKQFGGGPASF